jgi:Tfp pilus assembly protein PilF
MAGEAGGDELNQSTVAELARWAGANLVISGSVFKLGDVYRIDAQAYDTDTGTITVARKVEGDDLFVMVTELTAGLREGLQLGSRTPDKPLPAATSSEEAFRLYTAAGESYDNLEFERAVDQLAHSLRVDPKFVLARLRLAMSQYELGDVDAATGSVRQVMLESERLPEADRMLAQALGAFLIGHDLDAGSAHLERLLEEHPRHRWANVLWARGLDELADDPLGATRKLQRAIEQDPNNLLAIASLADHLARFGAASDAEVILRDAATRNPQASVQLERIIATLERPSKPVAP